MKHFLKIGTILAGFISISSVSLAQSGVSDGNFLGVGNFDHPSQQIYTEQQLSQRQIEDNFYDRHIPRDGIVLRQVDAETYNVSKSQLWNIHGGTIQSVRDGIVLLDIYKAQYVNPTWYNYGYHEYLPGIDDGGDQVKEFDRTVAITNLIDLDEATIDKQITFLAMKIGTIKIDKEPLEFYDCGTPYFPPPPSEEQLAAVAFQEKQKIYLSESNAIIWLLPQATNGDVDAQCDLGEHYLNGQGCETNRELAIYWLKQAAANGDIEASNKLAILKP